MNDLPLIPTPLSTRLRELRVRSLPAAVFTVVLIALAFLWHQYGPAGGGLTGVAEGIRSTVTSPQPGKLDQLLVQPYQIVRRGEPIAILQPIDPRAQLDLLQSHVQLARMRLEPSVAQQNAMNFERVRIEYLRLKQELAVARINLERAENQLRRDEQLYKEKLLAEDLYDLTLKTRDMYRAEVDEKALAVTEVDTRMTQLRALGEPPVSNAVPEPAIVSQLEAEQALAQTNWAPITLFAPIDGMVHLVCRHENEFVIDGEPLLMINSQRSDHVVGYLRQPYPFQPEVGMHVEVVTRDQKRQKFTSQIIQIGAQVEIITNALAFVRQGSLVDVGLPVVVQIPPLVKVRPGELVDIHVARRTVAAASTTGGLLSRWFGAN